jgi:4-amino-4-deoxy-L-arabinose transferase-like glycosyltransferase
VRRQRIADLACCLLLIVFAWLIIFLHNSAEPMHIWDESRVANIAYEMAYNGHWIVAHFNGAPDHWSTKPPLYAWCVALLLRLGLAPLMALRLPSMLAGLATILLAFMLCRYRLQDRLAGIACGLILLCSDIFVGWHGARTGDRDSFLALFVFVYVIAFGEYLEAEGRQRTRWIEVAGIALALSLMSKGAAGVFAVPGLLLYAAIQRRFLTMLRDRRFWIAASCSLLLCGAWYGVREALDPGYLQAVWHNEIGGRYLTTLEGHTENWFFYLWILEKKYKLGFLLLPLAAITFSGSNQRRRSVALLCLLTAAVILTILSGSQTKIQWYITPAAPLLALATSIGLSEVLVWLRGLRDARLSAFAVKTAAVLLIAVFAAGLARTVFYYQVVLQRGLAELYMGGRYGPFLEEIRKSGLTKQVMIVDSGADHTGVDLYGPMDHYNPEAIFFARVENRQGMQVSVSNPGAALVPRGLGGDMRSADARLAAAAVCGCRSPAPQPLVCAGPGARAGRGAEPKLAEAGAADGAAEIVAVHFYHDTHFREARAHAFADAVAEGFVAHRAACAIDAVGRAAGGKVGVVGGDDGGALVVVARVENEGDGVPHPVSGLGGAQLVEDEDFGVENGPEDFHLCG